MIFFNLETKNYIRRWLCVRLTTWDGWSSLSVRPHLESTEIQTAGHTCEEFVLIGSLEVRRPTLSGPNLLVAASFRGHGRRKLLLFACLSSSLWQACLSSHWGLPSRAVERTSLASNTDQRPAETPAWGLNNYWSLTFLSETGTDRLAWPQAVSHPDEALLMSIGHSFSSATLENTDVNGSELQGWRHFPIHQFSTMVNHKSPLQLYQSPKLITKWWQICFVLISVLLLGKTAAIPTPPPPNFSVTMATQVLLRMIL